MDRGRQNKGGKKLPYVSSQILGKIQPSPTMSIWLEEDSRKGKKLALCIISNFGEDTRPSNDVYMDSTSQIQRG